VQIVPATRMARHARAVVPAFVLDLARSPHDAPCHPEPKRLRVVVFGVQTPIYFLTSGMSVSLSALSENRVLLVLATLPQELAAVPGRPALHVPPTCSVSWGQRKAESPRVPTRRCRSSDSSTTVGGRTPMPVIRVVTDGSAARKAR
jgi:hypothetical protein